MVMEHLGFLLTTYCNLNCRDCADMIPYRCNVHYNIEDMKNDLHKILSVVEEIEEVLLIGGEVLMYPWLQEAIELCAELPKIKNIIITTNGTIVPSESLCKCISDNKVSVRVSGYPKEVAPNRTKAIERYKAYGAEISDLDGMTWYSMGDNKCRNRSKSELIRVFSTCLMRYCVTIDCKGNIFYCSRQFAANEGCGYPKPRDNEGVNVRKSDNIENDLKAFYELEYISTCDYCDGISDATREKTETAIQIVPKRDFLKLLEIYLTWDESISQGDLINILLSNEQYLKGIDECRKLLESIYESRDDVKKRLLHLVNRLMWDYNYEVSDVLCQNKKHIMRACFQNVITVSGNPDSEADIVLTDEDVFEYAQKKFSIDIFDYNRLYVKAKLGVLNSKQINTIICGLSYTQYGVMQSYFRNPIANLSVTGQDMGFQISMARLALSIRPEIDRIVFPMTYYQGYYDMSSDDADIHRLTMAKVNVPLFYDSRNYNGPMYDEYYSEDTIELAEHVCDMADLKKQYELSKMQQFEDADFFGDYLPRNTNGGLKFSFFELSDEEKYISAQKTAELNERIITETGFDYTYKILRSFISTMKALNKKVFIFVPPMTKYLYEAYNKDYIKRFYATYVPLFKNSSNVMFVDYALDNEFEDKDFCDFEHLSEKGARLLSSKLNGLVCY